MKRKMRYLILNLVLILLLSSCYPYMNDQVLKEWPKYVPPQGTQVSSAGIAPPAPQSCAVHAVDLIGAWVSAGASESQDVLSDATQTFIKLMKAIKALPDEYFDHPESAEWFMKPYWSRMSTIPEAVLNLSADHYDEHIPSIKAWIEKSMEVTK